jgi:hypothetical protein
MVLHIENVVGVCRGRRKRPPGFRTFKLPCASGELNGAAVDARKKKSFATSLLAAAPSSPRLFPTKSSFFMLCVALLCVEFPFVFAIPSFDLSSSPNDRRDGYLADRHVDSHGPSGLRCASGKRIPHWLILGTEPPRTIQIPSNVKRQGESCELSGR